jgi:hypothetical protein
MMTYLEIKDGVVVGGSYSLAEGETKPIDWVESQEGVGIGWSYIDGVFNENYKSARERAYPPMAEQFDMQYWDNVDGTTVWQDTISAIKEQFPKEVDNG